MLLIKRHTLLIYAAKGNSEKPLGNLTFFEREKILQSFSIIIKNFRRPKEGRKNVLLRGRKRGGIRKMVGFEERKVQGARRGIYSLHPRRAVVA